MNTSAKITTVTFLAAMALGATVLTGGCSVNSTTSSDTDGGPSSSSGGSSSGGSSSGGSSSGSTSDGGGDAGATCQGNDKQTFTFPDACQACLESKCCDKLKACYNQDPGDAGDVDCNTYSSCISDCNAKPEGAEQDACYEVCDNATNNAITAAYEILTNCGNTNCATECGQ